MIKARLKAISCNTSQRDCDLLKYFISYIGNNNPTILAGILINLNETSKSVKYTAPYFIRS